MFIALATKYLASSDGATYQYRYAAPLGLQGFNYKHTSPPGLTHKIRCGQQF